MDGPRYRTLAATLVAAGMLLASVHAAEQDPCALHPPFHDVEHEWKQAENGIGEGDADSLYRIGLALMQCYTCGLPGRVPEGSICGLGLRLSSVDYRLFSSLADITPDALRLLTAASALGDGRAQDVIHGLYAQTHRTGGLRHLDDPNIQETVRRALEESDPQAQYDLGRWYRALKTKGRTAIQNEEGEWELVETGDTSLAPLSVLEPFWYVQAAQQGHAEAQSALSLWFAVQGKRLDPDGHHEWKWSDRAAAQGDPGALWTTGLALLWGLNGREVDPPAGVERMREAARGQVAKGGGIIPIWLYAGELGDFLSGNGAPLLGKCDRYDPPLCDREEALFWYRFGAQHGSVGHQLDIGMTLLDEESAYRDVEEGLGWVEASAVRGHPVAQAVMGDVFRNGEVRPKSYVRTYAWYSIAVASLQGEMGKKLLFKEQRDGIAERAQWLEWAEGHLTRQEIAQGQRLASTLFAVIRQGEAAPATPSLGQRGSGVVFGRGEYVVTNHHVVEECPSIEVVRGAERTPAVVAASDPSDDLALLRLSPPLPGPTPAFRRPLGPSLGESVLVAGFPFTGSVEDGFTVTLGNVSAVTGVDGRAGVFQLTAPVQQGNSGGPVLGPGGELLGVVVATLDAVEVAQATGDIPQNVNYAVHAALVRAMLDLNGVQYQIRRKGRPQPDNTRAEEARAFTVAVVCGMYDR